MATFGGPHTNSHWGLLPVLKSRKDYLGRRLYLEIVAAFDEGVGNAEEAVVAEVQHAEELEVLELPRGEDRGQVVTQLVVTEEKEGDTHNQLQDKQNMADPTFLNIVIGT